MTIKLLRNSIVITRIAHRNNNLKVLADKWESLLSHFHLNKINMFHFKFECYIHIPDFCYTFTSTQNVTQKLIILSKSTSQCGVNKHKHTNIRTIIIEITQTLNTAHSMSIQRFVLEICEHSLHYYRLCQL